MRSGRFERGVILAKWPKPVIAALIWTGLMGMESGLAGFSLTDSRSGLPVSLKPEFCTKLLLQKFLRSQQWRFCRELGSLR
ncbi:hypothetical protein AGR4C_Cc70044 [Agrobacterium tumefaciens str. Kerr 14]|uniref:Uncharacterized protein n=1 Tax=Agrobacterium tumefaciens str. Kerr 14 TaxID=1183424 RepID=A0A1S7QB88_AGRTU|nr:hypothetical protein AGR4C_Cc70044 [Agrobacterium tumefaciens str. Kerr 14]